MWFFKSKHVVVRVEPLAAPAGYVRCYTLSVKDTVSGFGQNDVHIGLESAGYDDTIEAAIRMGVTVIGGPSTLEELREQEARNCAVKLLGFFVGNGRIPEDHITLREGVPAVTSLSVAPTPPTHLNALGAGGIKFTVADLEDWIDNDEGLYNWWKDTGLTKRKFIRQYREEIRRVIDNVNTGKKSAGYLAYEKKPPRPPGGGSWNGLGRRPSRS